MKGQTLASLVTSKRSHRTLRRRTAVFLTRTPAPQTKPNPATRLIIDATWFGRKQFFLVYWDHELKYAPYWRYTTTKEAAFEIAADLAYLKTQGVWCSSVTSDGGPGIVSAVSLVYPRIPHQRCVVHIERQLRAWLSQNPRTQAGKDLRAVIAGLATIPNHQAKDRFVAQWRSWCSRYESFLNERTYFKGTRRRWQYTHRNLRRCRSLVARALPDMWHYLDDARIPKDTNGLEGRFGALKQHYRQHRGLSKHKRAAYLSWYVLVCEGMYQWQSINEIINTKWPLTPIV